VPHRNTGKKASNLLRATHESPWATVVHQGDLTQGKYIWSIRTHDERMLMMKKTSSIESGRDELAKLIKISEYPHIMAVREVFMADDTWFLESEYARITLEEVLSVHTPLTEPHIRVIASSVRY
jgi:hypothetical protein